MRNQLSVVQQNNLPGDLLEKVTLGNDLSDLTAIERIQYVTSICQTLGLNPVTRPIQIMKFQNKLVPYFSKDATEQLRKINKVSILNINTKMHDGGVYVVTATASTPDGRQDSSTGAIVVQGLKGDVLANAMMKAETKAKRRVTLSICGLGFIDECEVNSIPGAQKIEVHPVNENKMIENDSEVDQWLQDIKDADSIPALQAVFTEAKKQSFCSNKENLVKIIDAKDERKMAIMQNVNSFNEEIDAATGEVLEGSK
jgi:hypothetical protein